MKRAKRFLSILLTLCMVLSMIPGTAFAANSNMPFTDVKEGDWFYDAVEFVYEEGMMNGTGDVMFSPNVPTTRGMIWTILARYAGHATDGAPWYAPGQAWAMESNVSDGTDPMGNITREQMVTMLYRYAGSSAVTGDLSRFLDANQVSDYAKDAMIWAVTTGIITGDDKGYLAPKDNATRAETAAILMRFCGNDTSDTKERKVTFHYNYGDKDIYLTNTVVNGGTVKEPKDPARSGYQFVAWYSDSDCTKKFDFNVPIIKDVTVYAKWRMISGGGGSSTPPSDIQITIQGPEYDEDMNRIVTQDQKITLTGTAVSSKTISRVTVTYAGYDKPTQSAQVTGSEAWSAEIPLEIGTNAIQVTATNAAGQTTTFETVVNRTNAKLEYKDSFHAEDVVHVHAKTLMAMAEGFREVIHQRGDGGVMLVAGVAAGNEDLSGVALQIPDGRNGDLLDGSARAQGQLFHGRERRQVLDRFAQGFLKVGGSHWFQKEIDMLCFIDCRAILNVPGDENDLCVGSQGKELHGQLDPVLLIDFDIEKGNVRAKPLFHGLGQVPAGEKGVDLVGHGMGHRYPDHLSEAFHHGRRIVTDHEGQHHVSPPCLL